MKHDPEEVKEIEDAIELIFKANRDLLNLKPRIANPLKEARDAARVEYETATSDRPKATA